tara:strand:+ start:21847 stop:23712 length:1866 start_codon:yes stop_codon:yes gene_type:complete
MCGIAGYITKKKYSNFSFKETSKNLAKLMKRRGPDQQGSMTFSSCSYNINLFSSRLSIIDLDNRSNQPFKYKELVLIYNGEIYNYLEIKNFLKTKKIKFKTNSDTEVLIKSYQYWGEKCIEKFDGMWSFCIFDYKKNKIFISRDNFGEKPLYYFYENNNFVFGSEIKFINEILKRNKPKEINFNKVNDYISKGYKSLYKNTDTFFKNIYEVERGSNISLNLKSFKLKKNNYLDRKKLIDRSIPKNLDENIFDVKKLLIESLKLRLRSDVPISFCLSGGIDSASLVSLCYKHFNIKPKCFSIIDKDKRYNEKKKIDLIKKDLNCDINYIYLKKESTIDFISTLKNLVEYHDSPLSTISYYIHSKISRLASKNGFKVIFSGTGADEIFTGYYDHFLLYLNEIKSNKNLYKQELTFWKKYIKPLVRNKPLKNYKLFTNNPNFRDHIYYDKKFIKNFIHSYNDTSFKESSYTMNKLKNRMLNELFHESVPVILKEDDLNSMYNSIENRSPFLSKKLVSYCLSLNNSNYISKSYSKNILRCAMNGILSDNIRLDRKKIGFNSNIKSITNFNGNNLYNFLKESLEIKEIANLKEIKKIKFNNQLSNSTSKLIFSLINLKIFFDCNKL